MMFESHNQSIPHIMLPSLPSLLLLIPLIMMAAALPSDATTTGRVCFSKQYVAKVTISPENESNLKQKKTKIR
jgi:hypothetical protein